LCFFAFTYIQVKEGATVVMALFETLTFTSLCIEIKASSARIFTIVHFTSTSVVTPHPAGVPASPNSGAFANARKRVHCLSGIVAHKC